MVHERKKWRKYIEAKLRLLSSQGQIWFYTKEDFCWSIEAAFPNECPSVLGGDGRLKWKKDVRGMQQTMKKKGIIEPTTDDSGRSCWLYTG